MTCKMPYVMAAMFLVTAAGWSQPLKSPGNIGRPTGFTLMKPTAWEGSQSNRLGGPFVQEPSEPAPAIAVGSRVRVQAPSISGERLEGIVVKLEENAFVLNDRDRGRFVKIPVESITTLELWKAQRSKAAKGLGFGLLIGAGAGAVIGILGAQGTDMPYGSAVLIFGGVFGLAGGGIGALVGSMTTEKRWVEIPREQIRFVPGPL